MKFFVIGHKQSLLWSVCQCTLVLFYSYRMVLKNCLKYIFKNLAYFWKYEMCLYENYALSIIAWHLRESYVASVEKNICFDEGNNGKDYD